MKRRDSNVQNEGIEFLRWVFLLLKPRKKIVGIQMTTLQEGTLGHGSMLGDPGNWLSLGGAICDVPKAWSWREPQQLLKWHDPTLIGGLSQTNTVTLSRFSPRAITHTQEISHYVFLCSAPHRATLKGKLSWPKSGSYSSFSSSIASGRVSCTKETPINTG